MKIIKTNGEEYRGDLESAGSHYYVEFECEKCGKISKKQIRRFKNDFSKFICGNCLLIGRKHSEKTKKKIGESSKKNNVILFAIKESHSEQSNKKREQTNIKKYGGKSPMSSPKIKEIVKNKALLKALEHIKKNGFEPVFEDYNGKENGIYYKWKCLKCGEIFEDKFNDKKILPRCPKCNPYVISAKSEQEMYDFIPGCVRYRDKWEIDCYIKDKKIGFEFNGLYWHSDKFKDKNYHLEKTNFFKEKGIRLYHIFEDEWDNKKDIVKSIIKSKLGEFDNKIFARKCEIKYVNSKDSKKFQEENHIQGKSSSSVNIGLYYNNELVSLMTFGKCRFGNYEWELVRFVNKKNTQIIGGASKLFKKFIKDYNPSNIVSYSDTRLFDGKLYEILNFKYVHDTPPQYYYIKNNVRFNRMGFQKKLLKRKLSSFNIELTEQENMLNNGFNRIYDCGVKVWLWNK